MITVNIIEERTTPLTKLLKKQFVPSPSPHIRLSLISYEVGGLIVKGYMAEPKTEEPLPGLLYLRGGIKRVGMVRPARMIQWAMEGFIVVAPFYRGNWGGEGQEDFAGVDREDAFAAFDLLAEHPNVIPSQIHVFGFSRGGVMALLCGIYRPVASVTTWNGVSDMVLTYEERVDLRRMMKRVIGGTPGKKPAAYAARTPLHEIALITAPVLIVHGKLDEHVSFEHARRLEARLIEEGKPYEAWYFPAYSHQFPAQEHRKILTKAANWMKQHNTQPTRPS
ncbi:S9 family peptidase [Halalkalibacterium halodurans]|uniref:Peptidase n=1 Tax=Halalkalibacterium halodurans TaxID=86665 RepID=A0A0M0KGL4_ALKHA|nr:S9 family peptidase [Halalkalibacterium halodurans]